MPELDHRSLDHLAVVALGTRMVLLARLAARAGIDAISQGYLASESLPYVNQVAEGLRLSARTADADWPTMTALVRQAGIVPAASAWTPDGIAAALSAAVERSRHTPKLTLDAGDRLLALGHARLIFALLPATPAYAVAWPGRRASYADIDRPRDLGEFTTRVEELERILWSVATGPLARDPMARRTYAFFEAAALLATEGPGAFQV